MKNFWKHLKDRGIGMTNVLITSGLLSTAALLVAKMSQNQAALQRSVLLGLTKEELDNRLTKYLSSAETCNANFQGETFDSQGNIKKSILVEASSNLTIIENDMTIGNRNRKMIVEKIWMSGGTSGDNALNVQVRVDLPEGVKLNGVATEGIVKTYPIKLNVNSSTRKITDCFVDISEELKKTCEDLMDGEFNETTQKCDDSKMCDYQLKTFLNNAKETTETICGKTYKIEQKFKDIANAGAITDFIFPNNYVLETAELWFGAGGGGGGCGGTSCGCGGRKGEVKHVTDTFGFGPGDKMKYYLGRGGKGHVGGRDCRNNRYGEDGEDSWVVGSSGGRITALGGDGGENRKTFGCHRRGGEGINIVLIDYATRPDVRKVFDGGRKGDRSEGGDGGFSSGGGCGHRGFGARRNRKAGGDGGPGWLHIRYKIWKCISGC